MRGEVVTIISGLIEMGGIGVFLWFLLKGLRTEISNLNRTIEAQKRTLEAQEETLQVQKNTLAAMEARIGETEKVGDLYRRLLKELPEDLENYRKTLAVLKDEVIKELAEANRQKDERLRELTKKQLEEIASEERVLEELPALRNQLVDTIKTLDSRLGELDLLQPDSSLRRLLWAFESFEKSRGRQSSPPILLEVRRDPEK